MKTHKGTVDQRTMKRLVVGSSAANTICLVAILLKPSLLTLSSIVLPLVFLLVYRVMSKLRYEIDSSELRIVAEPLRMAVPLNDIRKVERLDDQSSSIERLRLTYEAGGTERSIVVTPEDGLAFLDDLREAGANLAV
jgi:hypothetical protein